MGRTGWLVAAVTLSLLTACGGGGGSGDGDNGSGIDISPDSISMSLDERESASFSIGARAVRSFSEAVLVVIVDDRGILTPYVSLTDLGDNRYELGLQTSAHMPVGRHQGALEIRLCKDEQCASEHEGSPLRLPYDIQVQKIPAPAQALSPVPGAPQWETYQGSAGHAGFVPVTVDPARFSTRWRWAAADGERLAPVAVSGGRVAVVNTSTRALSVLDEETGNPLWTHAFTARDANPAAISGGKVYVATSGHDGTAMWSFDVQSGQLAFSTAFSSQWDQYLAPTVMQDTVYSNGGNYGGLLAWDTTTGEQRFFVNSLAQRDEWTPAVDGNYAYVYLDADCTSCQNSHIGLQAFDRHTGALAFAISDVDTTPYQSSTRSSPVLGSGGRVFGIHVGNRLTAFDTTTRNVAWSVAGHYTGSPAVAEGVVYAIAAPQFDAGSSQLEARRESDGTLLWSWAVPAPEPRKLIGSPLVTNNVVFVSGRTKTHAVDIATRQRVWSFRQGGQLALSAQGVLVINTVDSMENSNGGLVAITVR